MKINLTGDDYRRFAELIPDSQDELDVLDEVFGEFGGLREATSLYAETDVIHGIPAKGVTTGEVMRGPKGEEPKLIIYVF